MAPVARNIVLVCLTPRTDANELGAMELPSYGIKRIQAAVVADPALAACSLHMIDLMEEDIDAYVEAIDSCEPDLIGISMYVWSTPCLIEVARRIKLRRPKCIIVFGGPSARTEVFDLPVYPNPCDVADAVVATEGEAIFTQIARLPELSPAALNSVAGLQLPLMLGWHRTGAANRIEQLDSIASPYQLGLMPKGVVAYLESFRGCPMSCRFCEWGMGDGSSTVFSEDYLVKELQAFDDSQATSVFLVDAGLNLNARAFKNLQAAERQVGFLKRAKGTWAEIYPHNVRDEHLEFISSTGVSYLGIGLQSLDPRVLKDQDRPFKQDRFEESVRKLAKVAYCEIQIIMGLPGDTPEGFQRTLEFALSLPAGVRAYHCLVLPDALLNRSRPEWDIKFNPFNMAMTSCLGWREQDFAHMRKLNDERTRKLGGSAGEFWWYFPPRPSS